MRWTGPGPTISDTGRVWKTSATRYTFPAALDAERRGEEATRQGAEDERRSIISPHLAVSSRRDGGRTASGSNLHYRGGDPPSRLR